MKVSSIKNLVSYAKLKYKNLVTIFHLKNVRKMVFFFFFYNK